MRGLAAVLGREVFERRLLAAVALGLGLMPLAAVWLPGLAAENHDDVRNGLAFVLALGLSAMLAILLGGSVLSRDLGEGRLGFYFSRPLRGWSIWAGKLGAVLVLSLGSALLVALPSALLNGHLPDLGSLIGTLKPGITWAFLALLIFCLILVSHAFSVMLRARTAWLALDLAGAAVFAVLVWEAFHRLGFYGAYLARQPVIAILSGLGLVGLLAAGARQVTAGRTDPRRAHRALSLTLWGVLLAGALGAQGFTGWVLAGTPRDLRINEAVSSSGSWIVVDGADPRRHLASTFLVDRKSGRFHRLLVAWLSTPFSADGRWAVWPELAGGLEGLKTLGPIQLTRLDLRRPGASPFQSNVWYPRPPKAWALSPDGSQAAAILDGRIVIDEIATGSRLAAAPLPHFEETPALQFVGPGRIQLRGVEQRTYLTAGRSLSEIWRVWAMDVTRGHPWSTGGFEDLSSGARVAWSGDGSRALISDPRTRAVELLDGWTGRPLAQVPWEGGEPGGMDFLSGGRIAVVTPGEEGNEIRIFSPDLARELRRCRIGGRGSLAVAAEPAPDLLALEAAAGVWRGRERLLLLDLATGSTRELRRDLRPVGGRLFLSRGGHLFELDPKTAELRPVLGVEED